MSSYAVSETSGISTEGSLVTVSSHDGSLSKTFGKDKRNTPSSSEAGKDKLNLPTVYQEKNVSVVDASGILANKFPHEYSSENYQKALTELRLVLIGIGSYIFLVYLGWAAELQINFTAGGGFVYNAGLTGGILMLVALIYAVIKRIKSLRRVLPSETSYYIHIGCGAVGTYLVLLHTSFELRSINGSVALITTLLVIISGALGRYLYTLSTILLHRRYIEIKDYEQSFFELIDKYGDENSLRIRKRLSKFALHCFNRPKSILQYFIRWMSIIYYGMYFYLASKKDIKMIAKMMLTLTNLNKKDAKVLSRFQKRKLRQYIFQIITMGYINLVEQVLRHWRVLHIPALYILTLTVMAHVVVTHMY